MALLRLSSTRRLHVLVAASFGAAFMLHLLVIPSWLHWLWPSWSSLVLLHWLYRRPDLGFGIVTGGLFGLLLDALSGGLLGRYALGMALMARLALALRQRLEFALHVWQQCVLMLLPLLGLHGVYSAINLLSGRPADFFFGLPAVVGACLWPPLSALLENLTARLNRK